MTAPLQASLAATIEAAAAKAGLRPVSITTGTGTDGGPTSVFELELAGAPGRPLRLELTESFEIDRPELVPVLEAYLVAGAKRLRNPRPDCAVTLGGLPIAFGRFSWPFHRSTSGADSYIIHGEVRLADGRETNLHAKVSASVTVTMAEFVPAMEQPWAEHFVYNAIRKTVDLGQLEFLRSGNRQPVPVTTRFWSRWKRSFVFSETAELERTEYLLRKVYWLSGVLGEGRPVWIGDPHDAEYLNTAEAELVRIAGHEAGEGLLALDGEFASPTPALMARAPEFQAALEGALNFTKPQFNEEMRSGQANM